MKAFCVLLAFAAATQALPSDTMFGYLTRVGIPLAEKIRQREEESLKTSSRITGGQPASLGNNPWQAGILATLPGVQGVAVCGGALISSTRVATAANCYYDGLNTASLFTVVLGSLTIFYGGVRVDTSSITTHPEWDPTTVRNNIAVVYFPFPVATSSVIQPVALPTGSELTDTFSNTIARASGYGVTSTGSEIGAYQSLYEVESTVLSNVMCGFAYPTVVTGSNICTSGNEGAGLCSGDLGGPLVTYSNDRHILIGVASFFNTFGCEIGSPSVFSRVSSYKDFLEENL